MLASDVTNLQFATLQLTVTEQALLVTINRPEALNALDKTVLAELNELLAFLQEQIGKTTPAGSPDWSLRAVILTGQGEKSFVAGANIVQMQQMDAAAATAYAGLANAFTTGLETLPVPVLAAVNGYALGGGCELALACDYIYASQNALFGQPEVGLGLIPGFGGCVRLPRRIGIAKARELIYTGAKITAQEALGLGLINRVFATQQELIAGCLQQVSVLVKQSPVAIAAAKRVLNSTDDLAVPAALSAEQQAFANCFTTADMRAGTTAFVNKTKPVFVGE